MSKQSSQLSYRVVEPLRPDYQAGLWVARWLAVACAIQSLLVMCRVMQASWDPDGGNYRYRYAWFGPSRSTLETVVELSTHSLLCLAACFMAMCAIGLAARGRTFRRMTIASIYLFCIALFVQAAVPLLQHSQISGGMSGYPIEYRARMILSITMGWLMNVGGALLPMITLLALSRPWLREAMEASDVTNCITTVRRIGIFAVVLASMGLLLNGALFTKWASLMSLFDALAYLRPRDMSDAWVSVMKFGIPICLAAQLIGGLLVCGGRLMGAKLLAGQARVSIILNVVTLFYLIAGRAIFNSVVGSAAEGLTADSVMRFMSISIDLMLWMYFGSAATREALGDESRCAIALATPTTGEAHAIAG